MQLPLNCRENRPADRVYNSTCEPVGPKRGGRLSHSQLPSTTLQPNHLRASGVELLVDLAMETENDMQYEQLMHMLQKVASPYVAHPHPATHSDRMVRINKFVLDSFTLALAHNHALAACPY